MTKHIFFDVDGVLLDMATPFLKFAYKYNALTEEATELYDGGVLLQGNGHWDLLPFFETKQEFWKTYRAFEESADYSNLPVLVPEYLLQALSNCGASLYTLSSGGVCGTHVKLTRNIMLTHRFGNVFSGMFYAQDKLKFLAQWANENSTSFSDMKLVDDKPATVKTMWNADVPCCMIINRWNADEIPECQSIGIGEVAYGVQSYISKELALRAE